jgi:HEAT repeat protein
MTLSEIEKLYAENNEPSVRMEFVSELLRVKDSDWRLVEKFAAKVLLEDANPIVRHEAAFVLGELRETGRIGDGLGATALQAAAISDTSSIVRHEAAESVYCFRGESVDAVLLKLLDDEIEDVRLTAAMSISWRNRHKTWLTKTLWNEK